ncbi:4178_t:CDS:2 [Scutellospora calospora]|uniref:4178_t:CDS:1 n=1 Tax=Scutellospora calospora TaxID=85575 RepID=A0ACA9KHL6_9GLOM|nr:4178_t:CDS:2 [Scutellospora calospora]
MFKFLNPFLKLSDHCNLGNQVLNKAIDSIEKSIEIMLKEDLVGVTLIFDVFDISSERENHAEVIKKTELMMHELRENNIILCATPKVLNMSKLRADITYKHRQQQNLKFHTNLEANMILDVDKTSSNTNNEENNSEIINKNDYEMTIENNNHNDNDENNEEYNELEKEEIYEKNKELLISEEDFGEYLQG